MFKECLGKLLFLLLFIGKQASWASSIEEIFDEFSSVFTDARLVQDHLNQPFDLDDILNLISVLPAPLTTSDLYETGLAYYTGKEGQKDKALAKNYFKKAAKGGHTDAMYILGFMYKQGEENEKAISSALHWLNLAAEQDHLNALLALGYMYFEGSGVEKNLRKATFYFKKTKTLNCLEGWYMLGRIFYIEGTNAVASLETHELALDTKKSLKKAAQTSFKKAKNYFETVALKEFAPAQYTLGLMYELGRGIQTDQTLGTHWIKQAAINGHTEAQFDLGCSCFQNKTNKQDPQEAVYWFTSAAQQGHARAQYNLALMYERGDTVPENPTLSLYWYKKAASQGHLMAQSKLETFNPPKRRKFLLE